MKAMTSIEAIDKSLIVWEHLASESALGNYADKDNAYIDLVLEDDVNDCALCTFAMQRLNAEERLAQQEASGIAWYKTETFTSRCCKFCPASRYWRGDPTPELSRHESLLLMCEDTFSIYDPYTRVDELENTRQAEALKVIADNMVVMLTRARGNAVLGKEV